MIIGIDIDDIICNTVETMVNYINTWTDLNLKFEDIQSYWIEDALPDNYKWMVEVAFHDTNFWKKVKMIDGAAQGIKELYNSGHEIYFATATTPVNFKKKVGFLKRNLSFFPEGYVDTHMINIKNKQLLRFDVLIDDYLKNLTGDRTYTSICMKYPWNSNFNVYKYPDICEVIFVKNWKEICEMITKM